MGWRLLTIAALILFVPSCSHYSCYGIQFNRIGVLPRGAILVTDADEHAHPSLAWVAQQVADGKQSAQIDGRSRMDDFSKFVRERNLDVNGIPTPSFVVRGVPVLIRSVSNCLI